MKLGTAILAFYWLLGCPVIAQEEQAPAAAEETDSRPEYGPEPPTAADAENGEEEDEAFIDWPALPEWDPEDAGKLKNGEIVPGEDLLREITGDLMLPPAPEELPEEALPPEPEVTVVEVDPTVIEARFLDSYFGQRPGSYLMDPQEMLARQDYRDRESFLEYHAGDSRVKLYVYLFDAEQELPAGVGIESVFDDYFAQTDPTALVFYFLGRPERSQMVLSESIRKAISVEDRDRALRTAIREAFEKSDLSHQLENFSVELSIRLYWFEKAMDSPALVPLGSQESPPAEARPPIRLPPMESKALRIVTTVLWSLGILLLCGLLGWIGRMVARKRVRYVFPEVEVEPLLGAPHAAGVGAVISFTSAQTPPAQQRDQVPDYLQRM